MIDLARAIIVQDGTPAATALAAVCRGRCDATHFDMPALTAHGDAADVLRAYTNHLAAIAELAREHGATRILLPLQLGLDSPDFARAAEWCDTAGDMVAHGLGVTATVEMPLLELAPWQVADLARRADRAAA